MNYPYPELNKYFISTFIQQRLDFLVRVAKSAAGRVTRPMVLGFPLSCIVLAFHVGEPDGREPLTHTTWRKPPGCVRRCLTFFDGEPVQR
jgi:hypothetical protein